MFPQTSTNNQTIMKRIAFIFVALLTFSSFVSDSAWKNDKAHSELLFTVTHLGISDVTGSFTDFDATITSSKEDFSDAVFTLSAKTSSVNTRVEMRDNHLKSADFFDAEKFPTLDFKSTKLTPAGKGKFKVSGNLTLRGVTKPVSLELTYRGTVENPMSKKPTAGFQATGVIKRSEFGFGSKFPAPMISDEVRLVANGEFQK